MSEKSDRRVVIGLLRALDAGAVENRVEVGTPDVQFIGGWMELKWLDRWPSIKSDEIVRLRHYTQEQRNWARRRKRRGGACWLLLHAGRDWLLFDGEVAAEHVGRCTKAQLFELAERVWRGALHRREFLEHVSR